MCTEDNVMILEALADELRSIPEFNNIRFRLTTRPSRFKKGTEKILGTVAGNSPGGFFVYTSCCIGIHDGCFWVETCGHYSASSVFRKFDMAEPNSIENIIAMIRPTEEKEVR